MNKRWMCFQRMNWLFLVWKRCMFLKNRVAAQHQGQACTTAGAWASAKGPRGSSSPGAREARPCLETNPCPSLLPRPRRAREQAKLLFSSMRAADKHYLLHMVPAARVPQRGGRAQQEQPSAWHCMQGPRAICTKETPGCPWAEVTQGSSWEGHGRRAGT